MIKRILCGLLCLLLLLGLAAPALAAENEEAPSQTLRIHTVKQFLRFVENCRLDSYSQNLTVSLTADLDLTGVEFSGIPIFCGEFQGNGHSISGLRLTGSGSQLGLFRYLTDTALVSGLKVLGEVAPEGTRENIGGIAGSNAGRIENCTFEGDVSGGSGVGGIAGENTLSGIIENCHVQGSVNGSHFVGGVAGKNSGVIRSCENHASVNTTVLQNTVSLEDITLESMVSSESAATVTDIGGIAGHSTGVIRSCVNHADVGYQHMGYNIGGIAGTQAGHIVLCQNLGSILGRKEVGGIVGQLEPAASIEYEEDALQILKRQLSGMGSIVNKTASNVQSAGDSLYGQVYDLQSHVEGAQESIGLLIPDKDNPQLPDADTIQAAKNGLSTSISGMSKTLNGMEATVESSVGKLSNNLHAMQNQMNAMNATLGNAAETLGGSITDVSDQDTELDLTGKIEACRNSGAVLADLNAGGIAGAMAMENDLDVEEDLDILGDSSLNFESKLRAVILNCENSGAVTAGKRAAGGITGWQSLGLVKDCRNTGSLEGGEYAGGISGQSSGYIRTSYAKCALSGTKNLGGIAGSGAVVTDCRALVEISGASEEFGAILGQIESNNIEDENPIAGNFYFPLDDDLGGIDGISYDGQAQSLGRKDFFGLEDLPELFQRATVAFVHEDGRSIRYTLQAGSAMDPGIVPDLPEKPGYYGCWQGMEEENLDNIYLDLTFTAAYHSLPTVIASEDNTLLLQGTFAEDTTLTLTEGEYILFIEEGESVLGAWDLELKGSGTVTAARLRLPGDCDSENIRLMIRKDGQWQEAAHTIDGSYAVIPMDETAEALALVQEAEPSWYLPAALGAAAVLTAGLVIVMVRKKKKK